MKNLLVLSGRLPGFNGTYTPAEGDKKSRMNWSMNVALSTKNESGYYDEALIYFTAWGYYADMLQQINSLDPKDPNRREFSNIEVCGRLNVGYKDKDGNIKNSASIEVQEISFRKTLQTNNENAFSQSSNTPSTKAATPKKPGVPKPMSPKPMASPFAGARPVVGKF